MKLRANPFSIIRLYSIIYLISSVIFYMIIGIVFPPKIIHYIVIGGWTLLTIAFIYFAIKNNYYVINRSHLLHVKGRNELTYDYKTILYIDTEWSIKHKTLLFYTDKGHARYFPLDKKQELLHRVSDKCKNLITKEAYQAKFPKTKM